MSVTGSLTCRDARMDDAELLWRWANDSETRRNSFNQAPILYNDHLEWLESRLRSATTRIWIFSDGDGFVGQVRCEATGDVAELHIVVAPDQRGRGYGKAMLGHVLCLVPEAYGERMRIRAQVLKHNVRSLRLFEGCGFREITVERHSGGKGAIALMLEYVPPAGGERSHGR